jgi:hypothetical protein
VCDARPSSGPFRGRVRPVDENPAHDLGGHRKELIDEADMLRGPARSAVVCRPVARGACALRRVAGARRRPAASSARVRRDRHQPTREAAR